MSAEISDDRFPNGEALADALEVALQTAAVTTTSAGADESVSTGQARAIWQRAAQLQAEAGSRLQARYRAQESTSDDMPAGGFRLRDVELAATEAGIGAEYVAMAVAERTSASVAVPSELTTKQDRTLTQMLGTHDRSITATRVFRATPKIVLEAIGRVFTVRPFSLALRDTVGGHPLDGGIMVFDVPMYRATQTTVNDAAGISMFNYHMTQIEVDRLNVVIKPVAATGGCEVTVYGDLRKGLSKNWRVDKWIAGSVSTVGAAVAGGFGAAGLALGALAVLPAVGGAVVAGGLSLAAYRWVYRHALRKANAEIETMLAAIDGNLRAVSVFGAAAITNDGSARRNAELPPVTQRPT